MKEMKVVHFPLELTDTSSFRKPYFSERRKKYVEMALQILDIFTWNPPLRIFVTFSVTLFVCIVIFS